MYAKTILLHLYHLYTREEKDGHIQYKCETKLQFNA